MKVSRRTLVASAAALSIANPALAAWREDPLASGSASNRADDYLRRLSGFGYSGATMLVRNGEVLLRKGYGSANDAEGIPVAADTIFDIGSMAKTFTAGAMLRLVTQGRVQLSDPIARFLAGVPDDKSGITIEQLLSHTGGLARDFDAGESREISRDEAVQTILATALIGQPGDAFRYSNSGYVLAAAIVELAAECPFREFVRTEILAPLGMTSSGFWGALPTAPDIRFARGYDDRVETVNLRTVSGTTWADLGGGQMVSTLDDLALWLQAMRGEFFLPRELRDRMWTPVKATYGLGWAIEPDAPGGRRIHHGGDTDGFGAELALYPDHDLVLINLANRVKQFLGTRYAADRILPPLILGQPLRLWPGRAFDVFDVPPRWSADTQALDAAVGTYRLGSGGEITVTKRTDDDYRLAARGQDAIDVIFPTTQDQRAIRARCNERAIALIHAGIVDDRAVLADTLRSGAPIDGYQSALATAAVDAQLGNLISIEAVGTAPFAYPVGGRVTSMKLNYDRGPSYWRVGWDPTEDRVRNMGDGSATLGSTPLQGSGDNVVGWDIVTGRAIRLRLRRRGRHMEIETSDGARTVATRVQ